MMIHRNFPFFDEKQFFEHFILNILNAYQKSNNI